MTLMRAIVVEKSGPPEVLKIKKVERPSARPGWVLIRVRAFGLNRSEMFTRQGHSPDVRFPRILGIEAVGEVVEDVEGHFEAGQKVAAVMGGMGRDFDGGYAEYALIPGKQLMPLETNLPWSVLGAIPEMFLTVYSSLTESLEIASGQTLLVRGGTSSIGLTTITVARNEGLTVLATSRSASKAQVLLDAGADHVLIDDGRIADKVREILPQGVDRVQELIGTKTLLDSLKATAPKGIVCFTGILGNEWVLRDFEPFRDLPSSVKLTTYQSETLDLRTTVPALQAFIDGLEQNRYTIRQDRVFAFDEIVTAHQIMESNQAVGKMVVMAD